MLTTDAFWRQGARPVLELLKKIFGFFDAGSKRLKTTCEHCGHVMQGSPGHCPSCGHDLTPARD